ncbi:polymer-forming cytoskeletal protein [Lachnospiraceae bacterium ZAX-1]
MSFFKDFKDDFSQAVNELMPGEEREKKEKEQPELVVNTLEDEVDVKSELQKLEGLFEKVEEPESNKPVHANVRTDPAPVKPETPQKQAAGPVRSALEQMKIKREPEEPVKEEISMSTEGLNVEIPADTTPSTLVQPTTLPKEVTDEIAVITEGTTLTGNLASTGSIEIRGIVNGDIQCNGKMTITGTVKGNSTSAEFFADSAKVEGEIITEGTVKIGLGSVVIGNISATSAVIAGAIKGDIDVQGPVVVDTSAVVMGNIKSRSVQINNGAVIEGFCSQCYADVDVISLFSEKKEA